MRYSVSEKYEIIQLVDQSSLSVKQTLRRLDINPAPLFLSICSYFHFITFEHPDDPILVSINVRYDWSIPHQINPHSIFLRHPSVYCERLHLKTEYTYAS
jgi:hypothetical protein